MDEPRDDEPLKRKISFTFWLLAALLLLVTALMGFSLFGPNPPIEIGKATTRITTPLDANGLPDYAAVLLADSGKGVTLENNGAVPFLMAMWPEKKGDDGYSPEEAKLLCAELGLPGVPPVEGRVSSIYTDKFRLRVFRFLREQLSKQKELSPTDAEELDPTDESLVGMIDVNEGMSDKEFLTCLEADAIKGHRVLVVMDRCNPVDRPWTAEELPFLAEWLEENNTALDLLVEAAERPKWHFPSPGLLQGGSGILSSALASTLDLRGIQELRNAARLLTTRSHFYQGNGDYAQAARDAMAILRLSHHASEPPFILDQLVAIAIGGVGLNKVNQIVADKGTPVTTLRTLLTELDQIGPFSQFTYSIDQGERFFLLDSIISLQNPHGPMDFGPSFFSAFAWVTCDLNPTLKTLNAHCDAIVVVSKLPTWSQRQAAYAQVDARVIGAQFPPSTTRELVGLITARGRGQAFANLWLNLLGGNVENYYVIEDRTTTERQLTRLGIALAIHRAEQGAYPESLNELVPSVLQKIPVDLFHSNPFVYRRTDEGFLLYSLGPNGTDDRGSTHGASSSPELEGAPIGEAEDLFAKIPEVADDLSLRVPLPEPEPWPWETAP